MDTLRRRWRLATPSICSSLPQDRAMIIVNVWEHRTRPLKMLATESTERGWIAVTVEDAPAELVPGAMAMCMVRALLCNMNASPTHGKDSPLGTSCIASTLLPTIATLCLCSCVLISLTSGKCNCVHIVMSTLSIKPS